MSYYSYMRRLTGHGTVTVNTGMRRVTAFRSTTVVPKYEPFDA